ncbi:hypothetical protein M5689_006786 [Euphorbia peplus]|nr:hypothetical protein M5689_006786 [Euphorbia peplus]
MVVTAINFFFVLPLLSSFGRERKRTKAVARVERLMKKERWRSEKDDRGCRSRASHGEREMEVEKTCERWRINNKWIN